ncbi:riboflavin synthase [Parvicella tangerina]|uniref:Riboflavin synthase n=1 Tax=Parvicella tangerina TaxID=2829795 RepID=A0A916JQK0_9FLAO|nr:riboflavin synthase [Parvicella tangerina]CAG5086560.1 Riboflavin synthase [Parvicella tangerina]
MFTGIIETLAKVRKIEKEGTNIHFTFASSITSELKIDQSVAHNGVCLTVVGIKGDEYIVTAIQETLDRTNLGNLAEGDEVNLERCTQVGARLDGHIVQGHVDQTAIVTKVEENDGSWNYHFEYEPSENITVEKGSITINGVSLTVVDSGVNTFSVSIIPYTYEHTNFKSFKVGTEVNLEFDIVGKYVSKLLSLRK